MREWLGTLAMAKGNDGDAPNLTEPEIIRVLAVGGQHIRTERGWVYLDAWEQLSAEKRVGARLAMTPQNSLDLWTELGQALMNLGLLAKDLEQVLSALMLIDRPTKKN